MLVTHTVNKPESRPERLDEGFRAIAPHWKAAAALRAVKGEGRYDGVSSVGKRGVEPRNIGSAIHLLGEEVKGGAIVPDVVSPSGFPDRHVGDDPLDAIGVAAHCRP